jgi:hypothetical protein
MSTTLSTSLDAAVALAMGVSALLVEQKRPQFAVRSYDGRPRLLLWGQPARKLEDRSRRLPTGAETLSVRASAASRRRRRRRPLLLVRLQAARYRNITTP